MSHDLPKYLCHMILIHTPIVVNPLLTVCPKCKHAIYNHFSTCPKCTCSSLTLPACPKHALSTPNPISSPLCPKYTLNAPPLISSSHLHLLQCACSPLLSCACPKPLIASKTPAHVLPKIQSWCQLSCPHHCGQSNCKCCTACFDQD